MAVCSFNFRQLSYFFLLTVKRVEPTNFHMQLYFYIDLVKHPVKKVLVHLFVLASHIYSRDHAILTLRRSFVCLHRTTQSVVMLPWYDCCEHNRLSIGWGGGAPLFIQTSAQLYDYISTASLKVG